VLYQSGYVNFHGIVAAAVVWCAAGAPLHAGGLSGFTNFTANGTAVISTSPSTLMLTDGGSAEAGSAWFNTPLSIGSGFTAQFVYTATYTPSFFSPADGITFTLQNSFMKTAALGGFGGQLGYTGISPSAAVELNIYKGFTTGEGPGTAFNTNGNTAQTGGNPYAPTAPVDLTSQHPILVTLTYNSATNTLSETLEDETTGATFSTSYVSNLATDVGGTTAYFGFTGGSGTGTAVQVISDFTLTAAAVPEPAGLTLAGVSLAGLAVRGWRRRAG
jgi:hypothetical protein